jgi:hypothetical protein
VFVKDWGGTSAFEWIDTGILGLHLIPVFAGIIEHFTKAGYVDKKTVFGAPYDWRMNPVYISSFMASLKSLVETIYMQSGGAKVALFGYSAGGYALQYFLTRAVEQPWKDKYVDRAVFGSPSLGGSVAALRAAWDHKYDALPEFLEGPSLSKLIMATPCLYGHLPNWRVFADSPVIVGPDGTNYSAKELPRLLEDHGKLPEIGKKIIADAAGPILNDNLDPPGVDTYLLYNTRVNTTRILQFWQGWNGTYRTVWGGGDGTVSKEGMEYTCEKWKKRARGKTVVCHDLDSPSNDFDHYGMLKQKAFIELVWEAMTSDDWLVGGGRSVSGTDAGGWVNLKKRE